MLFCPLITKANLKLCSVQTSPEQITKFSEDPFVKSDKIEETLNQVIDEVSSKFSANQELNEKIESTIKKLNEEGLELQQLQEKLIEGETISAIEFESLQSRIERIQDLFSKEAHSKQTIEEVKADTNAKLDQIIIDPLIVEAEKPYDVMVNSENISIVFSEKIVKEVFLAPSKKKVVSRSLRKIQKGVFGANYSGEGIIRMHLDSNVAEIRALGEGGNFRFFGYFENENFHIVYYTVSSNHTAASNNKNVRKVMTIRNNRGH